MVFLTTIYYFKPMKKYLILIIFFCITLLIPKGVRAQFFVGAGANYTLPTGRLNETNKESPGITIMLESRKYCNLWYGLRADYLFLKEIDEKKDYYQSAFYLSPEARYIFASTSCSSGKLSPYVQITLTFSSIGGRDERGRLGVGAGAGGGAALPFVFLRRCWSLDFNAMYSAPNFILRADGRPELRALVLGASINMCL